MSVEQLEQSVLKLSPEERRRFVNWFYEHQNEILQTKQDEQIYPAARAELELRLKEIDQHPELLEPFEEEDMERMIQKTIDAHAKKSPARRR